MTDKLDARFLAYYCAKCRHGAKPCKRLNTYKTIDKATACHAYRCKFGEV